MAKEISESQPVTPIFKCQKYINGKWQSVSLSVPAEMAFSIYLNSKELVTILCTPLKLNCLVLGYLFAEGIINDLKDITTMRVCEDDAMADVKLKKADFVFPPKRILTSGCGGGTSFDINIESPEIVSRLAIAPERLLSLMRQMLESDSLHKLSGGIHISALTDGTNILVVGEDIGRHNTIDKIMGECILLKITTEDKILLSSGRISSEMVRKAVKMRVPIICSLTSPTERSILMADKYGITLVGYARGNHLTVYTKAERLAH